MNDWNDSATRSWNSSSSKLARLRAAALTERAKRDPDNVRYWAEAYRNIAGGPMVIAPALHAIYADQHPFIVVRKPSQVGATEFNLNTALWAADTGYAGRGVVLYLMPTQESRQDLSGEDGQGHQ